MAVVLLTEVDRGLGQEALQGQGQDLLTLHQQNSVTGRHLGHLVSLHQVLVDKKDWFPMEMQHPILKLAREEHCSLALWNV